MMLTADQRVDVLREYGQPYRWLVETGTADGYTTTALIGDFDRLVTIELDEDRYLHVAVEQYLGEPKVLPLHGDSARVLKEVVYWLAEPALFWLDAHYSGGKRGPVDTPIVMELDVIASAKVANSVLIDDARLFGHDPAYPSPAWLSLWAAQHGYRCEERHDILRLTPICGPR